MENGVEVLVDRDLVDGGEEVDRGNEEGGVERAVAVGGLDEVRGMDGDDEVFEEAREQLPHLKAVMDDVNEEEVYVTPVVDSSVRNELEGTTFEEAIETPEVGDECVEEQVEKEDYGVESGTEIGLAVGGKSYAEVLVQNMDGTGNQEDNLKETDDAGNGSNTESLHEADAVIDKSEIQEIEGKNIFEIGEHELQTSEGLASNDLEGKPLVSYHEDQANGVLSCEDINSEELKVGHSEAVSSEVNSKNVDNADTESSGSVIPELDPEDAENEDLRLVSAAINPEEALIVKISEPDATHDAESNGSNTESLHEADAVVDKSEIQEIEGKNIFEIGEHELQTSEGLASNDLEGKPLVSYHEDQANGVLSCEDINSEELKVDHSEAVSSEVNSKNVDNADTESSGLVIPELDLEDAENEDLRLVSAAINPEEALMVKISEPDATHDAESASFGTGDNHVSSDHGLQGENGEVYSAVGTDSSKDSAFGQELLQSTDNVVLEHEKNEINDIQVSSSDDFEDTGVHTKEVDIQSLPHIVDGRTATSEVALAIGSVTEADHFAENGEVANNNHNGIFIKHQDVPSEQPEQSSTLENSRADEPALVTDSAVWDTESVGSNTVTEVSPSDQAGLEVLKRSHVADKEQVIPASVPSLSSDRTVNSASRPAGLGRAAPLLEPAPRVVQQLRVNGAISQAQVQLVEEAANGENDENDETREKLQMIRVKFLRLAHRLGQTPHNVVVAQVLYRLGLAEQLRGRNGGRVGAFSFDRASAMAEQLETVGQEPLDFSCTIMVLGKTGVGKSATINSIFDEVKFGTDAFQSGTKKVQDVVGTVQGIKVRVIDTPGLLSAWSDQSHNEKILHSVKSFIKKTPPDIVLYLDRLDMHSRDFGDMPLLRTITKVFGPSIWFNAIVVLTHAASAPPDGPNGIPSNYDTFVTQRSRVVQHAVRQAAGDMRLMNPVSLVENHTACRTNRAGQRVLPNGQIWKPHLLLLSFASKILAEANTLLKLQDGPPGKPFATRSRAPPLPYLLSSMLQSRPHLRLPEEQMGGDDGLDDELEDSSDSDDDLEYDELPPFEPLTKAQLSKLSKAQRKDYFDELEYREKLLMKRQLKEEKHRRKMLKKMAAAAKDTTKDYNENVEEETNGAATVPVPMPDLALPASFDSDNPTHRYRCLDSSNPWLVRPVLETQGWDHEVGYEGINVERSFVVKEKLPLSFSGQITKDKKDATVQMEVASTLKHGEGKATSVGLDLQTVGTNDIAYTFRSESTFCNIIRNKLKAGMSFTLLGDALSAGIKLEDKLITSKRFRMVLTGGAMTSRGDIAYGGSLEATLRDKDHPLGRSLSTLGLSVMDWHGDLAIGCNIQSQIPVGHYSNLIARANLNNKGSGQVSIRFNSSEQLQIALVALLPLLRKVFSLSQESLQY